MNRSFSLIRHICRSQNRIMAAELLMWFTDTINTKFIGRQCLPCFICPALRRLNACNRSCALVFEGALCLTTSPRASLETNLTGGPLLCPRGRTKWRRGEWQAFISRILFQERPLRSSECIMGVSYLYTWIVFSPDFMLAEQYCKH